MAQTAEPGRPENSARCPELGLIESRGDDLQTRSYRLTTGGRAYLLGRRVADWGLTTSETAFKSIAR
jgi:hypothetical protein